MAARQLRAPDGDRLDHRGPAPGAETRREVAERVGACVAGLMADEDHDHVVVTHGFAHDDGWGNRTLVDLGATSHLTAAH